MKRLRGLLIVLLLPLILAADKPRLMLALDAGVVTLRPDLPPAAKYRWDTPQTAGGITTIRLVWVDQAGYPTWADYALPLDGPGPQPSPAPQPGPQPGPQPEPPPIPEPAPIPKPPAPPKPQPEAKAQAEWAIVIDDPTDETPAAAEVCKLLADKLGSASEKSSHFRYYSTKALSDPNCPAGVKSLKEHIKGKALPVLIIVGKRPSGSGYERLYCDSLPESAEAMRALWTKLGGSGL